MDIRGFTVHDLWIEQASDISSEYYASVILDRSEKKLLAMLSRMGGMDVEEMSETDRARSCAATSSPAASSAPTMRTGSLSMPASTRTSPGRSRRC